MKKIALIAVLLFAGCSGTRGGGGRGLLPEIPTPKRPILAELTPQEHAEIKEKLNKDTIAKIRGNIEALHLYTRKLEIGIEGYNNYVRMNNALVRQELGIPAKKEVEE